MSARTTRTRLFAATALAVAALTLTACNNGEGVKDEGASAASSANSASSGSSATSGAGKDAGKGADEDAAGKQEAAGAGSGGGADGSANASEKSGGSKGSGGNGSSRNAPCTGANTKTTATEVASPLNHLLLTVTNTGSKNCDLVGYPMVRFGEAQSVPPAIEDSKPQAVVTLAPGDSGYAGVLLSAGDGSGSNGYTAKSLEVFFDDGADGAEDAQSARPSLPAKGVHVDDKLSVTYWQQDMSDALTW